MTNSVLKIIMLAGGLTLGGAAYADCPEGDPGCDDPPPQEDVKGNNGWGNGPDTTNNGSFSGATAPSKSTNGAGGHPRQPKFEGR